jgi:hypothetical protein
MYSFFFVTNERDRAVLAFNSKNIQEYASCWSRDQSSVQRDEYKIKGRHMWSFSVCNSLAKPRCMPGASLMLDGKKQSNQVSFVTGHLPRKNLQCIHIYTEFWKRASTWTPWHAISNIQLSFLRLNPPVLAGLTESTIHKTTSKIGGPYKQQHADQIYTSKG